MSCDTLKPLVGVGVVVIKNNKILLGKRKGLHEAGAWATPGGHLEFGEDVEECARRELLEETGLEALSVYCGPWVNNVIDKNKHYITLFVWIDDCAGELQLMEPDKCEGWHWFGVDSLPEPLFPTMEELIKKIGVDQLITKKECQ